MNKNLPFEMRELTGVSKFASVPLVLVVAAGHRGEERAGIRRAGEVEAGHA